MTAMWLEIMAEFSCKVSSTWLSCDDQRKFLHAKPKGTKERTSQVDYENCEGMCGATFTLGQHGEVHGIITLCMQRPRRDARQVQHIKKRQGWRLQSAETKAGFNMKVTRKGDAKKHESRGETHRRRSEGHQFLNTNNEET